MRWQDAMQFAEEEHRRTGKRQLVHAFFYPEYGWQYTVSSARYGRRRVRPNLKEKR